MPKFDNVFCSSCGEEFGPGDHGFSHCEDHPELKPCGACGDSVSENAPGACVTDTAIFCSSFCEERAQLHRDRQRAEEYADGKADNHRDRQRERAEMGER